MGMGLREQQGACGNIEKAIELGFDDVAFVEAEPLLQEGEFLKQWIDKGFHGGMEYMTRNIEKRNNPSKLVENARTVVVVLKNYTPQPGQKLRSGLKLARYAYGRDYHKVLKSHLKKLFSFIGDELTAEVEGRFFVDSAPVSERSLAVRAGLGWRGKNTNLIHPRLGSYVFIGELFLNIELPSGTPIKEACGGCTRCIDACPTGALVAPYQLDTTKCISYLTIENKDSIPSEFSNKFDGWFFGCDICQEACPWNWNARPHKEPDFNLRSEFRDMNLDDWIALDETTFDELSKGSPIRRAGYHGLMRNLRFVQGK